MLEIRHMTNCLQQDYKGDSYLLDLVLSRCHWLMTAPRTPAPLRKDLHEQTTWRSVAYRCMAALNGVTPDPIKLNDQEVRIIVRMDYFLRKIILFLSQLYQTARESDFILLLLLFVSEVLISTPCEEQKTLLTSCHECIPMEPYKAFSYPC